MVTRMNQEETTQKFLDAAQELYADPSDDDIEIDHRGIVSIGEEGAWVAAWVYVRNEEAGLGGR